MDYKIYLLQNNLILFRIIDNLSIRDFAKIFDVSHQTINNWEKSKNRISKIQYYGIRSILYDYIQSSNNKEVLSFIFNYTFNNKREDLHEIVLSIKTLNYSLEEAIQICDQLRRN